ncbi:hypothetical protein OIU84_009152 [Salix udensis]|uniref:Uncharacterized protein n=1 Tax=Salix udensis TaxID=889485 RepID=A0AAD6JSS3_9ROSI|nr:hypothetical protein OIU84_009152 [Salix udensis]
MVQKNQRLVVFTSKSAKEAPEVIASEWRYVVENQYGDGGMIAGSCPNRRRIACLECNIKVLQLLGLAGLNMSDDHLPSFPKQIVFH